MYSELTTIAFLPEEMRLYKMSSFFKKMKEVYLVRNMNVLFFINCVAWFLLSVYQATKKLRKRATTYMEINLPAN